MANSTIFPIFIRSEYKDSTALKRFESDAQRAAQSAKKELAGVGAALDQALSRPRTNTGSLDLGVDELRRAAMAQQQVAAAAREVATATKAAALASGGFEGGLGRAARAALELASAEERATREMLEQIAALDAVQAELNKSASATGNFSAAQRQSVGSANAQRAAMQNLGFQLNDVATQFALGASGAQIFASQSGQIIQVLQQMAQNSARSGSAAVEASSGIDEFGDTVTDTADRAKDMGGRIGAVAGFLAGPWGIALTTATIALSPFIGKLFEGEEAGEEMQKALDGARFASDGMSDAQSALGGVIDLTTGRMLVQTQAAKDLARAQLQLAEVKARVAANEARTTLVGATRRTRLVGIEGNSDPMGGPGSFTQIRRPTVSAVAAQRALQGDTQGALDALKEAIDAGRTSTEIYAETATAIANFGVESENIKRFSDALRALEGDQSALRGFLKPKPNGRGDTRGAAREAERLKTFGEQAAERIARLNEQFDEQPRLIDQAARATRELDTLIKELGERKPANFEKLIEDAKAAKGEVDAALLRPFEQLREESEQRLQIEQLLAAGRDVEAAALEEILRLEERIGDVSAEQRAEIEGIVRAEAERTRELRVQQRLWQAQLDVVQTVEASLTDLLSGRSTDFFGNFRQALQDLQGQRLFESIFGDSFRAIEDELRGNSPQGRANAAYIAEVEKTASATQVAGEAAISLAEAFEQARAIVTGAANDNGPMGSEIVVRARETQEVRIARLSAADLASRIAAGIGSSIGAELEDIFGPRGASIFGDIVGGAIAGKVLGGDVGGVLGGAKGLLDGLLGPQAGFDATLRTGLLADLSGALGKAGGGAAIGSQVAGLSKLLGIGGSATGAQLGGAIGSFIPIPGGDIIGAIAGNLLGGLLKSTPRASATIGGVGGSLGLTSVTGTKANLRDAAGNLGDSVLEAVNRIAEQLGADVNAAAGRVSIGQRKDALRVDPLGRGVTKIGNGAIDFGQDAEAAIAFAVRDLIQDGVITGLKASEQRLIRAGSDIEAAVRDVLEFRSIFDRLKAIKDPLGAALDGINREFDGYRELFARANASAEELASLEELFGIERAKAIEEASERFVGSLRALLADLRTGDNGLSLRARRGNAQTEFDALAARVAAGDSGAFDDFAEIAQQLLDIERQLFGSTQSYFDRLSQVTALTEQAIEGQTNVASIAAASVAPVDDRAAVVRSIDAQTDVVAGRLDVLNSNFIALANRLERVTGSGFGGDFGPAPRQIANY